MIDRGDAEVVLARLSPATIARAWCDRHRLGRSDLDPDLDPDWWAQELLLTSAFFADTTRCRRILLALVDEAGSDEHLLGNVGAGPLEDFLSDDEDDLCWVEARAQISQPFRMALQSAWPGARSTTARERVLAAAGITSVDERRLHEDQRLGSDRSSRAVESVNPNLQQDPGHPAR